MITDTNYKANFHKNNLFPFIMFRICENQCTPKGPGYHYLHWHEDLQYTLVTKGSLSIQVNDTSYTLQTGEAIFINSSYLHMTHNLSENGEYVSFNFPAKLLSFLYDSELSLKYVLPFTTNYRFPVKTFTSSIPWEKELISSLEDLMILYDQLDVYGKNYEIAIRITQIWLLMIRNLHDTITSTSHSYIKKQENLQVMIAYIHANYMEDISLSDIAGSANISSSECNRRFSTTLHITPYEYLLQFRIHKSADFLKETNHSITTISGMVGFNDCSHFIQFFKKVMKITPGNYRKLHL